MAQKVLPALSVCVAMMIAPFSSAFAEEPAKAQPAQSLPSIVVTEAVDQSISDRVVATGTIQAVEQIYVAPLVEGLSIRSLNVDIGDKVEAGSVLVVLNDDALRLEKSQLEAALAKAEAGLAQLTAQLSEAKANSEEATRVSDRNAELAKNGTVSTAEADRVRALAAATRARVRSAEQAAAVSKADIKVAQSQIDDIDLRLTRTEVKAPVAGVISAKNAKIGAIANGSGEPLFAMIRDGAIEMKADVAEADIIKLAVGQPATITLAGGNTKVEGAIRLIAPTVDPVSRLGTVFISLKDTAKARSGMYASAIITAEEKTAVVLPQTAVTNENGKTIVRKVDNGVVNIIPVTTGISDGKFVEVVEGLKAGEEVVARAGAYVRDGDRINPVKPAQPATN
ncbi:MULTISPECIES: efflux RND transporter periplasmic adaptor subunit [Ensifer]|jgi:HlyD family secretion protein|uniref:Efflux RND transporter periplasmic adaptor subunit n=1 Tax=Ensifer canadensis TaxID=555315 RepID=A0AAW4FHD1_9HYPH|nr:MULTISPECIES: efflux RND transporter periplasmic adaptor subunit [Ensifer]MDP9633377.1 HlyD family secretion protein [Ensifer adhaerens]KQU92000.1 hemolysin secretion protein D [Ensifer sp. Root31]KQW60285.1 hemolysin secretion protein D [Ensifer sp. Root1252]KQW70297.1 hemolysin secretion protein D [Ensifer sp. Root127]KQY73538.1 hemolysin secretion protein D [Ensifer sp. Root142]